MIKKFPSIAFVLALLGPYMVKAKDQINRTETIVTCNIKDFRSSYPLTSKQLVCEGPKEFPINSNVNQNNTILMSAIQNLDQISRLILKRISLNKDFKLNITTAKPNSILIEKSVVMVKILLNHFLKIK